MRKSLCFNLFIFCFITSCLQVFSQNPEWINYRCGELLEALAEDVDFIWVGTAKGGLTKIDKNTGAQTYYLNFAQNLNM